MTGELPGGPEHTKISNQYTIMRKHQFILPMLLLLSSCGKVPDGTFTVAAAIQQMTAKTAMDDISSSGLCPVQWSQGDKISIGGLVSEPLDGAYSGKESAVFRFGARPCGLGPHLVLYPGLSEDGKVNFPAVQHCDGLSFAPGSAPMYAVCSNFDAPVTMKHVSAVLAVRIKGAGSLTSIDLKSASGEKICGDFALSTDGLDGREIILTPSSDAGSEISCVPPADGLELSAAVIRIVACVPPGTYADGFVLTLKSKAGGIMTLRLNRDGCSLAAGRIVLFPVVEFVSGKDYALTEYGIDDVAADKDAGMEGMIPEIGGVLASIKAGSFNIWSPQARKTIIDTSLAGKGTVSEQRYWRHSYSAVADMIKYLDCDVMGLQEVTDTVYGLKTYSDGVKRDLKSMLSADYKWVIYPSKAATSTVTASLLGSADAIIYKESTLELKEFGRVWLAGLRTRPGKNDSYGTNERCCTWASFIHKSSGKEFYFLTVHLDLPDLGPDNDINLPQDRNARELVEWFAPERIPESIPSIICGDMNCTTGSSAYDILLSGRWKDARDIMQGASLLDFTERRYTGTAVLKNETDLSGWRPDHILVDALTLSYYRVARERFVTTDGTLHYPSDHLPVVVLANF